MTPETLARLHAAAFSDERGWSAAEFAALLAAPGALLSGDARGFVLGRVVADEAEILTLLTDPALRRQGRATVILTEFEAAARSRGAREVFLEVAEDNAPARALYGAAGYAQTGRRPGYYARPAGPAIAALILRKPLT